MSEHAREATLDGRSAGGRVLGDGDVAAALAVCALDPVASVLATSRIEVAARDGLRRSGGQLIANGRIPIQAIIASIEADEELATEGA